MTDHLFIDTDRARDAATHLRSMHANGEDILADIRIAAGLAGLTDTTAADFGSVSDALRELATVIDQRSNLAESGGVLATATSAAQLQGISQALWGYAMPATDDLFPQIGPRSTRTECQPFPDGDEPHNDGLADDRPGPFGWLGDRADDTVDWLSDQPLTPPPLDPVELWNTAQDLEDRTIDSLIERDLGPIDRPVDWYLDANSDPLLPQYPPAGFAPIIDYALDRGVVQSTVTVGAVTAGFSATTIDGRPKLGLVKGITSPGLGGSVFYTPTEVSPQSGLSTSTTACAVVCAGVSDSGNGPLPTYGLEYGLPGFGADLHHTDWFEFGQHD